MSAYTNRIDDGHRHKYDKPPMKYIPHQLWPRWVDVDPQERVCIRCGHNQAYIRRWQRHTRLKKEHKTSQSPYSLALSEADQLAERNPNGLNNYIIIREDGGRFIGRHYNVQACYGSIMYDQTKRARIFVDKAVKNGKPLNARYITWWMTESPYSLAMLNDPDHFFKTRCTIQSCMEHPGSYIVSAAMGMRYFSEYHNVVDTWDHLTTHGIDPDIAFILASWGGMQNGYYSPYPNGARGGHQIIQPTFTPEALVNYLNKIIVPHYINGLYYRPRDNRDQKLNKNAPASEVGMRYSPLNGCWQSQWDESLKCPPGDKYKFLDAFNRTQEGVGWDISDEKTAALLQESFLKANGVKYDTKKGVYRQQRSTVCTDVQVSGVESSAA